MWSVFTAVHCSAWSVIYIGTLMMDIAELLGVKQVRDQLFFIVIVSRARNYLKLHLLNFLSENKETKYILILRCAKCNGTKKKI